MFQGKRATGATSGGLSFGLSAVRRKTSLLGLLLAPFHLLKTAILFLAGGPIFSRRLQALTLGFGAWLLLVAGRQAQLQIVNGKKYAGLADARRIHRECIPPRRGTITDRNGLVLAEDLPSYDISIVPAYAHLQVASIDAARGIIEVKGKARRLARKLLIEKTAREEPLVRNLVETLGCDRERLARALVKAVENVARKYYHKWAPQVIVADISRDEWLQIRARCERDYGPGFFHGIIPTSSLRRRYPQGSLAAHVVGSVGLLQKEHYDSLRRSGVLPYLYQVKLNWWKKRWESEDFDPSLKSLLVSNLLSPGENPDLLSHADVLIQSLRGLDGTSRAEMLDALDAGGLSPVADWLQQPDIMQLSEGEKTWLGGVSGRRMLPVDIVGETGVEGYWNDVLRGRCGYRVKWKNEKGYVAVREETMRPEGLDDNGFAPGAELVNGRTLRLTIDAKWQRAVEAALKERNIPGAAVFIDPRNGEILAMASYPLFDPNDFTPPRSNRVAAYLSDPRHPLINRAIQGRYQQASCFKVVASIAIFHDLALPVTYTHDCDGVEVVGRGPGGKKYCHNGYGCGPGLTVTDALSRSCNDFFFHNSLKLENGSLQRWARLFGYGAKTGIDIPGEITGLVPSSEWKRTRKGNYNRWERVWRPADTCDTVIGLGAWMVSPLQSAVMISAIANGGRIVRPHTVVNPDAESPVRVLKLRPDVLAAVRKGLYNCANGSPKGRSFATGYRAFHSRVMPLPDWLEVAGKTGTTDVFKKWDPEKKRLVKDKNSHAWFIGYAPAGDPRVAFAVILEHAGGGGSKAAPLVNEVLYRVYSGETSP